LRLSTETKRSSFLTADVEASLEVLSVGISRGPVEYRYSVESFTRVILRSIEEGSKEL